MKRLESLSRSVVVIAALTLTVSALAVPASAGLNTWTWRGPEGGAIRAVLLDPAAPSTIYVGTVGSGVFKSPDGGASWTQSGATLAARTVRALVTDGAGTIYAGVEDAADAASGGVFKSTDGGATWTAIDTGLTNKNVQALAWDGASLFAGTREESPVTGGVFKWDGLTWVQTNTGLPNQSARRVQALAVDSRLDPPVLYAGTQGEGVFKSEDGGANWQRIDNPANQGFRSDCLEQPEILALAVDETIALQGTSGAVLYAGVTGNVGSTGCSPTPSQGGHQGKGAGFFRYIPFGGAGCSDGLPSILGCWDRRMAGAFETLLPTTVSAGVWAIALNTAASPTRIYIGTDIGVFVSSDSAGNWDGVPRIDLADGLIGLPVRALGVDPAASCSGDSVRLHAGSGGRGMFERCPNVPVGELPWTPSSAGLTALRAQAAAVGLRDGLKAVFAGLVGGGVITSVDSGATWQDTPEDSLGVRSLAVDPTDPSIVYGATGKGVIKTVNGGDAWTPASTGLPTNGTQDPLNPPRPVRAIALDPTDPSVLYAAVGGIHRSLDGGATWSALNGNLPAVVTCGSSCPGNGTVSAFVIDHSPGTNADWGTLYAATDGSGVYRSTDGGTTWIQMIAGLGADLSVTSLAMDPLGQSGATLYAGTSTGKVFRSVNGGNWALFGSGLAGQPVSALVAMLGAPSKIFAALNGGGVYALRTNGTTWTAMNTGLSALNVAGLALDPEGAGTFYAATLGGGIFDFQLEAVNPPFVSISSPPPPTYSAAATPVGLTGTAGGGAGVFQLVWSTNRGHAGFATGTNPWSASVVLEPGPNVVTVTAVDNSFNQSSASITVDFNPPDVPASLGQFKSDGTTSIPVGGTTDETTVVVQGTVSDPDGDTVKLQVEVRPLGTAFSSTATQESSLVASGSVAAVTVSGLAASTSYHWQARTVNSQGASSAWVSFGANGEAAADFTAGSTASCRTEVIVDNLAPGQTSARIAFTGTWSTAPEGGAFGANASLVSSGGDLDTYIWKTPVFSATEACTYQVFVWWTASPFRATNVPYRVINNTGGPTTKRFNQQINGGQWILHGTYTFAAGLKGKVKVLDRNGQAAADAVRFVLVP